MGRGRSGIVNQSEKKQTKRHKEPRNETVWFGYVMAEKPPTVVFSEELLTALRQMNPRDIANILVNS